jgi:gas vesicle protein
MSDRSFMNDTDVGNGGNTMGMFLMGAIVGAGVALLLAPATGGDARKKVGEVARKLGSRASDLVGSTPPGTPGTTS